MLKLTHAQKEKEIDTGPWKLSHVHWFRWEAKFIFSDGSYVEGVDPDAMTAIWNGYRIFDREK